MKHKLVFFLISFLLIHSMAYEIRLKPPHAFYFKKDKLYADFFSSQEVINKEFAKYLKYGIVIHFTFFIDIMQKKFIWDELIKRKNIQKSLRYDLWKKKYIVTLYSPHRKEIECKTLTEASRYFLKLNGVLLMRKYQIHPEKKYFFKTRVTAKISQFKSYFHVIFSILSVFKYKTTYLKSKHYKGTDLLEGTDIYK